MSPTSGARSSAVDRGLFGALNSPLRMRVYGLAAALVAGLLIAIQLAGAGLQDDARDLAEREYQSATGLAASSVSARIDAIHASLAWADALVIGGDLGGLCEALKRDPRRPYQRLSAFSTVGNLRCSTVAGAQDQPDLIRSRSYFVATLATGDDQVGGPLAGAFSSRPTLTFSHLVRINGATIGVVVAASDAIEIVQPAASMTRAQRVILIGREGSPFEIGMDMSPRLPESVEEAVSRARATGVHARSMSSTGWRGHAHPPGPQIS